MKEQNKSSFLLSSSLIKDTKDPR